MKKQGFTLIELMIVVAIIAIIAAIAIPNLMASRIRANEAAAITCVKQYQTAQVTFGESRLGRDSANTLAGNNGFADNFRNLYYGTPLKGTAGTDYINLISQTFADAFANATSLGAATRTGATATASPYQGYYFTEPSNILVTDFTSSFALTALPSHAGRSGNNNYYVGIEGQVWIDGVAPATAAATLPIARIASPYTAAGMGTWNTL